MTVNSQDKNIDELFKLATKDIDKQDVLGKYSKPTNLLLLETLQEKENINLETIGFFLHTTKPFIPAPVDIIPFATTGGDGCYFAFITDFGNQSDLDNAPIIFVSPTDFDKNRPNQSNILFAENFNDFLSIMIKIQDAEIIRFKDVTKMDFDIEIEKVKEETEKFDSEEKKEARARAIQLVQENFKLTEIENLNEYYSNIKASRNDSNYIKTIDGVNIRISKYANQSSDSNTEMIELEDLRKYLSGSNATDRLKFYRDAVYIYKHYSDDFNVVITNMISQMKSDNLHREATVLDFEVTQSKLYDDYLNAKKNR